VWGQIVPSQAGDNASDWREAHLPRLVNPNDYVLPADDPERGTGRADVFLTMIAERAGRDLPAFHHSSGKGILPSGGAR